VFGIALRDEQVRVREKARLDKERNDVENVLARMNVAGDALGASQMRTKLGEIAGAIEQVISRAANVRMGYVYVISNVAAFAERKVRIGMTRRHDPMDRVRELGDAMGAVRARHPCPYMQPRRGRPRAAATSSLRRGSSQPRRPPRVLPRHPRRGPPVL